ncbi:MAG TPA: glycosyl hydrolase family 28-related protein, partial [Blastocatellia bacterium]
MRTRTLLAALLFSVSAAWCQTQTQVDYQTQVKNKNYSGPSGVSRTISDKLADFASVKDFGALGNATADDSAAINAALAYACPIGAKVFLPQGNYGVRSTITALNGCEGIEFSGPSDSETYSHGAQIVWRGGADATVFSIYGTSWSRFHDFTINGNNAAGVGLLFYADTVSPFLRSSQKDLFSHIYIINVLGNPGNCLQVGRLGHGDDVSQTTFSDFSIDHCVVGLYQAGGQTVENLYSHNTFGTSITKYSMQFDEGDVHLADNMCIGGGPAT